MQCQQGDRAPETRRERPRLAPRAPLIETALEGFNLDGFNVEETRRWGSASLFAFQRWANEYRHGWRCTDRDEANRQNALASYRRDGGR